MKIQKVLILIFLFFAILLRTSSYAQRRMSNDDFAKQQSSVSISMKSKNQSTIFHQASHIPASPRRDVSMQKIVVVRFGEILVHSRNYLTLYRSEKPEKIVSNIMPAPSRPPII